MRLRSLALNSIFVTRKRLQNPGFLNLSYKPHLRDLVSPTRPQKMPPKRTASTSSKAKRKASSPLSSAAEDSGDEVPASQSQSQSQSQRSRASKKSRLSESQSQSASQSQETSSANTQPTNVVLPVNIVIPPKAESRVEGEKVTRIVTWNVCGLAASQKKVRLLIFLQIAKVAVCLMNWHQGFKHYIEAEDPDVLILTETKVTLFANIHSMTQLTQCSGQ